MHSVTMLCRTITLIIATLALATSMTAAGDDKIAPRVLDLDLYDYSFEKEYSLGVRQHRLTSAQRVVGWQLSNHWYFGKHRGDDDGFGLIWQTKATQVAFTNEGVAFRRQL